MYVITGITGKVGGAVARALLDKHLPVRAVIRDHLKAAEWKALGCEVAIANMDDPTALTQAFKDAGAVFILPPSEFDPTPGFPEARAVIDAVSQAINAARPDKIVCISTIGAQASQSNLLTQRTLMEQALSLLAVPVTFLRPGWFMDNAAFDITSVLEQNMINSFLQPLDKQVPMIASSDVGAVAAALLQEQWVGARIVELEGQWVSPNDMAKVFGEILGKPISVEAIPRENWESIFRAQGALNPLPRIQMLDGFNEEWIKFEYGNDVRKKGGTTLKTVLKGLLSTSK